MKNFGFIAAALVAMLIGQVANAGLDLQFDDNNGNTVDVADVATNTTISYAGAVGPVWTTNSTGFGEVGLNAPGQADLLSLSMSTTAGGTLSTTFIQTDMTGGPFSALSFSIGGTTPVNGGVVDVYVYADAGNSGDIGSMTLVGSLIGLTANGGIVSGPFAGSGLGSISLDSPYSIGLVIDVTHAGAGSTSFDAFVAAVPEPGSMILWGSFAALGGVPALRRRLS